MKIWVFSFVVIFFSVPSDAQFTGPLGGWSSYLPFQNGRSVTQSDDKIIYATEWAIVSIDKEDFSTTFLSKVEGLSDIGISDINYDKANDQLLIAYTNSNLDIVRGNEVINLPNIQSNTNIQGSKKINDIYIHDGRFAYLSTDFGIVQLDINNLEFGLTTFTGVKINQVSGFGSKLFAATEDGIYVVSNENNINIGDFNNWQLLEQDVNLPIVYASNAIQSFNNFIYASVDRSIYKSNGTDPFTLVYDEPELGYKIEFLSGTKDYLICGVRNNAFSSKVLFFDENDNIVENGPSCSDRVLDAIQDESNRIWYADEFNQFRYAPSVSEQCQRLEFDSPLSQNSSDIALKNGKVYVASGGVSDNFGFLASREGFYILEEGRWNNLNQDNIPAIKSNDLVNFYQILPNPVNDQLVLGTYWGGVLIYDEVTEETSVYNQKNSTLRGIVGDEARERISGLAYDDEVNLWVANFGANEPISVFTTEGVWHSFDVGSSKNVLSPIIDENNLKWFPVFGNNGGVLVFDHGDRIEDPTDDQFKFINQSNSEITTNVVNTVAEDDDGSIWVGTAEGPVIFDCGFGVFDTDCEGRRIKVLQDSIAAFLLADVEIRVIEIDGANRKWFGTKNGIFVQSSSGETEELRFTTSNSPLFDDEIIDLKYDPETGEMYIATNKGLQSYRTFSTGARRTHKNPVYAFPNPVHPEYKGPIAIRGLAKDANVKITDINGKLVFETTALGGQATWPAEDVNGSAVSTGVYLVFSTSTDIFFDPDSFVTKILVVR